MKQIILILVLSFSIFGFANAKEWRDPVAKMVFVWVPGGSFQMGCHAKAGKCEDNQKPVRTVRLDGFWMGKHEVTQAQWKGIMVNNPSYWGTDNDPVEKVSWNDVQQFTRRLNQKSSAKFRLPSEAQWEYACRAGGKPIEYGTGNGRLTDDNANVGQFDAPTRVGKFEPNGLGLHDMSGNVSEWVQDRKTSYSNIGTDNPIYERSGVARVFRGGDWAGDSLFLRCSSRGGETPSYRKVALGFRLVRGEQPMRAAGIQTPAQRVDCTQTFVRVNEVKKMTFQYHKEKPKHPAKAFAKYKHEGGLYDKATWTRKARWKRKLRMRKTCTGKLREVEKIHSIIGEGTVVTVIRGNNIEKYWVAPFRSDLLGGLGVGDSKTKVIEKLGKPYRKTKSVWAYACEAFDAHAGRYAKKYGECLRVYFKGGAVVAAKYFQTLNCLNVKHNAFFAMSDVLNKMSAAFKKAKTKKQKGFKIYPALAFNEITTEKKFETLFKGDKPKARRKNGEKSVCVDAIDVTERLYTTKGGKGAVIFSGLHDEEIYWVGRFKSKKLKGVAAGDTRRTVIRKLGVPFQRNLNALAYACRYHKSLASKEPYACLKIFFKKSRVIGAYLDYVFPCR